MKYPWLFVILVVCMLLVLYAAAQRVIQVIAIPSATATMEQPATPQSPVLPSPTATQAPERPSATASFSPTARVIASPPSILLSPTTEPATPTIAQTNITSYIAYRVKEGDTVVDIATRAGSTVELIQRYNRFVGEVHVQQPLIIPQYDSAAATLVTQPIIVQRGTARGAVALTLDAGASAAPTTAILDALASQNIKITFFLSGDWIEKNPELTRRIVADGHEVGNHSVTHPDFRLISDEQIIAELDGMSDTLYAVAGVRPAPYLRPPFGSYDERVLRTVIAHGYLPIFWSLDSLDAFGELKSADYIVDRLTNTLSAEKRNGAILLAHCGNQTTADALPQILARFAQMGITVTTLSRVL